MLVLASMHPNTKIYTSAHISIQLMTSYCSALLKDGKVGIETISGGSEFHAVIELGKKEFWYCSK